MSQRPPRATIDFETRSACSIRACGAFKYSLDPTTELLCMAFRLPTWEKGRVELYHPAFPTLGIEEDTDWNALEQLFAWIEDEGLIEAHNAAFERAIWRHKITPLGWPVIRHEQWRCSAAKAAALSLPRSLGDATNALSLDIRKDEEGAAVMKKLVKPRKPVKAERWAWGRQHAPCGVCNATGKVKGTNPDTGRAKNFPCGKCNGYGYDVRVELPDMPILYHESRELFERLWAYCKVDVLAEEALSEAIPDLSPAETEMYLLDARINERGFELDTAAIDTALTLIDGEFTELNAELATLTGGQVQRATQRARMTAWFAENGLELDDTQADTIDAALESHNLSPQVRRGLELVRTLGRSSTAKFEAMRNWVCPDSRVHGGLLYHGASTGRWTGAGVQPHNFPRGFDEDPEVLWEVLKTHERETIAGEYGSVMEALSSALRGVIVAGEGRQLFVADYNAIECRVLFWLADDQEGLEIFRQGKDPYNDMATTIYKRPINRKGNDKKEGGLGKAAILGLGYGMGASKFVDTALTMGGVTIIEDVYCEHTNRAGEVCAKPEKDHRRENHPFITSTPDLMTAMKVVNIYRTRFSKVKNYWYDNERAAIKAVQRKGQVQPCGKCKWIADEDFLFCILPSGRRLAYPFPIIRDEKMPWGDMRPTLKYMGINQFNRQWGYQKAYGGLLVENITQAVSRDLMAAAMLRLERTGVYEPILSVHDELLAEAPSNVGDVKEFEMLMAAVPLWAKGLPVTAEGWAGRRYKK